MGRPPLCPAYGPMRTRSVRLDAPMAKRLKRLGHGNLSDGIRKAADARSFKRYHTLVDAIQGVINAYDLNEDVGPSIDQLVDAVRFGESRR